jgi:hypothetical protein
VGGGRKVVFAKNNAHYRVHCDLEFDDARQAWALSRIIQAFQASVQRVEGGNGSKVREAGGCRVEEIVRK